jgi:hypothetical protein
MQAHNSIFKLNVKASNKNSIKPGIPILSSHDSEIGMILAFGLFSKIYDSSCLPFAIGSWKFSIAFSLF